MIFPFFSSSIGHLEPDLEQFENRLIFDGLPKFPAATANCLLDLKSLNPYISVIFDPMGVFETIFGIAQLI